MRGDVADVIQPQGPRLERGRPVRDRPGRAHAPALARVRRGVLAQPQGRQIRPGRVRFEPLPGRRPLAAAQRAGGVPLGQRHAARPGRRHRDRRPSARLRQGRIGQGPSLGRPPTRSQAARLGRKRDTRRLPRHRAPLVRRTRPRRPRQASRPSAPPAATARSTRSPRPRPPSSRHASPSACTPTSSHPTPAGSTRDRTRTTRTNPT